MPEKSPRKFCGRLAFDQEAARNLGLHLNASYRYAGPIFGGGLFVSDLGHFGDSLGIMATVGYGFEI